MTRYFELVPNTSPPRIGPQLETETKDHRYFDVSETGKSFSPWALE